MEPLEAINGQSIWAIAETRLRGVVDTVVQVSKEARVQNPAKPLTSVEGDIARIMVRGPIFPHGNWLLDAMGWMSADSIGRTVREFAADSRIGAIVLDMQTPGGVVYGIEEAASAIFEARKTKRVIGVANYYSLSAGYWLISAADQVNVAPSGQLGSIGVIATHIDYSGMNERMGVKVTNITAGKYKDEGDPDHPLTEEARAEIQRGVNSYYDAFVAGVARNRRVSAADVKANFGEGRIMNAADSVKAGLADRVATIDQVMAELTGNRKPRTAGRQALKDTIRRAEAKYKAALSQLTAQERRRRLAE